jgi:hypothetical protein
MKKGRDCSVNRVTELWTGSGTVQLIQRITMDWKRDCSVKTANKLWNGSGTVQLTQRINYGLEAGLFN